MVSIFTRAEETEMPRNPEFEKLMTELGDRRGNYLRFDKSINLGNMVSMVSIIITIIVFGYAIIHRLDDMQFKVDLMWTSYKIIPR